MRNNQNEELDFSIRAVNLRNADELQTFKTLTDMFLRAASTVNDNELEELRDMTQVTAFYFYTLQNKFADAKQHT